MKSAIIVEAFAREGDEAVANNGQDSSQYFIKYLALKRFLPILF